MAKASKTAAAAPVKTADKAKKEKKSAAPVAAAAPVKVSHNPPAFSNHHLFVPTALPPATTRPFLHVRTF
jgi:hypothetical protein